MPRQPTQTIRLVSTLARSAADNVVEIIVTLIPASTDSLLNEPEELAALGSFGLTDLLALAALQDANAGG